jgi:hypothetical protein
MTLIPPLNFGIIEENLYRSAVPTEMNFPFLEKLKVHILHAMQIDMHVSPKRDLSPRTVASGAAFHWSRRASSCNVCSDFVFVFKIFMDTCSHAQRMKSF